MSKEKYRTPEFQRAYKSYRAAQRRGEILFCAEPICKMMDRTIYPADKMDVAHDPSGTIIIGPAHRHCNRSEGATRGNRMRRTSRNWEV